VERASFVWGGSPDGSDSDAVRQAPSRA